MGTDETTRILSPLMQQVLTQVGDLGKDIGVLQGMAQGQGREIGRLSDAMEDLRVKLDTGLSECKSSISGLAGRPSMTPRNGNGKSALLALRTLAPWAIVGLAALGSAWQSCTGSQEASRAAAMATNVMKAVEQVEKKVDAIPEGPR
jgi:hypothetical protein